MTITTRAGKGAPLTNAELDANFTDLRDGKAALTGATFTGGVTIGTGSGFKQIGIAGGGYDLYLGASGGAMFGYASQTISSIFNTAAVPVGIGTNGAQPLILGTSNFERARVSAGGNLLIGTTTDNGTDKLQVNGSVSFGALNIATSGVFGIFNSTTAGNAFMAFKASGNSFAYIGQASGTTGGAATDFGIRAEANLLFGAGGYGEDMRLAATGNLIIGTTTDRFGLLQVSGAMFAGRVGIPVVIADTNDANYGNDVFIPYDGGSSTQKAFRLRASYNSGAGAFSIARSTNSAAQFTNPNGLTYSDCLSITGSGNVLIGTASDDGVSKLQVSGNAKVTGALNVVNGVKASSGQIAFMGTTDANTIGLGIANGTNVTVELQAVESNVGYRALALNKMGGNVLIGTTTDDGVNKLQVNGSAQVNGTFTSAASVTSPLYLTVKNSTTTGTTANAGIALQTFNGTSVVAQGYVFATSNSWTYAGYGANSTCLVSYGAGGTNVSSAHASGMIKFFTAGESGGNERMRIGVEGNVLIGDTVAVWGGVVGRGLVELNGASQALIGLKVGGTAAGYLYHTGTELSLFNQRNGDLTLSTNSAERVRIDSAGNMLVGVVSGAFHSIQKAAAQGNAVLSVGSSTSGGTSFVVRAVSGSAYNAAEAAVWVGTSLTGRSINAGGTVNASGADYAEYMAKADNCGDIAKGAVVGVDVHGLLTDKWAEAVSFMVKTTNPSYVGGDSWGSEEALGIAQPTNTEHENYAEDLAAYTAALEAARAKVDRIAFAGQVPVNVYGAAPGTFIVPVQVGEGIGGRAALRSEMTLDDYVDCVGIVQNILPDGRANIRVKVA